MHISMPGYIEKVLARFGHQVPKHPQHQPHKHIIPTYEATIQYAKAQDKSRPLAKDEKKYIQQIIGTFLYYGRAVDPTMFTSLSAIASTQAKPTKETMIKTHDFLNNVATHQDAIITYQASNMVLAVHSDASYLSEPKVHSHAGGNFFMSSDTKDPSNNGAALNIEQIIKSVMASAAEAELGALYVNACKAVPQRQLLEEMGHSQPPTLMQTDNSTALGVITSNIQPRQTKTMDMQFHWLRCPEAQSQFRFFWRPGTTNLANYWTKHHCTAHHIMQRLKFLMPQSMITSL